MIPKITVITPTARCGGVDIWKASLQRQTFHDFEAFFIDEKFNERRNEVARFVAGDDRLVHLEPPEKLEGKFWNLSRSLNSGLAHARGELVVFFQDYIWIPPEAFQKFWDRYKETGNALISGVGHKGKRPNWAINLGGHLSIFCRSGDPAVVTDPQDDPDAAHRRPEGAWFKDPRVKERGFHPCPSIEWEGNFSCAPMKACEEVGGFDERFDAGWGMDNVWFADRAQRAGFELWLDEGNECMGYAHELLFPQWWNDDPKNKKEVPNNRKLWESLFPKLESGEEPFKVGDLEVMRGIVNG